MTSVWETILRLSLLAREGHEGDEPARSFAAKCAAIMHGREPEALTEAEVRGGWGELVNMVGGSEEEGSRLVRLTVLQLRC
jgi:hypothetical protein